MKRYTYQNVACAIEPSDGYRHERMPLTRKVYILLYNTITHTSAIPANRSRVITIMKRCIYMIAAGVNCICTK